MNKEQPNELDPERFNQLPKEEVVDMLITAAKAIAQQQARIEELKQEINKLPVISRIRTQNFIKTAISRPTKKTEKSEIRKTIYSRKT